MSAQGYTLHNSWVQARERLDLIGAFCDPGSIRYLESLGVSEGWRCLDVGAGGGSITEWLCRKVGASGHVLATDIDMRFLDVLEYPNLEVRRHDIATEALPEATFDLVYAPAVLTHLDGRDVALQRLASALKPGGRLLVEEADYVSWVPDPRWRNADLYGKGWAAAFHVFTAGGADFHYARRLYQDVCAAGLIDVDAEGRVPMLRAGTPQARFWQLTFAQLRDRMVNTGLITDEEMDEFLALHDHQDFVWMGGILMAVWGTAPRA
jgi:SAM-dependent methyltransferase